MHNIFNTLEEIQKAFGTSHSGNDKITLRSEQRDAIDKTKKNFCKRSRSKSSGNVWTVQPKFSQYLWDAKMRFGKTLCALQLAREMGVKRTLIVTHRPVVNQSWKDDFENVVNDCISGNDDQSNQWDYGTLVDDEQTDKRKFYDLERFVNQGKDNHYVFFVSMQYLRLSELVNTKTQAKNQDRQTNHIGHNATRENEKLKADILNTPWDLVVIDEAHEGTRTTLGKRVIDEFLHKEQTKMLHLSGTSYNLYEDFREGEIFTWDYVMEQRAKMEWDIKHPGEPNPYAELPKMNIFTYDISKNIQDVVDHEGVFTFNEFLRTWTGNPRADKASMPAGAKGRFVHEEEVQKFLQLLCTMDDTNNFPFSTKEYRRMFRHTLWVVSHVDEAAALTQLLREHPVFGRFEIINVAGRGDLDEQNENALDAVINAIGELPEKTSTITISCGRLTAGVTVRPWSAVLYLKGGDGVASYMQTIFRVQSPYKTPDGRMKTNCYVFDFAPDRTLKIIAETAKFHSTPKYQETKEDDEEMTQEDRDKETLREFIELCPVVSMAGGKMSPIDVNTIYKQLESVYIDRLVRKGFDDPCLYNQDELNKIDKDIVNHIGENGGQAPDERRKEAKKAVDLSHMTPEERAEYEESLRRKRAEAEECAKKKAEKDEKFQEQWDSWSEEQREEWLREEAERLARKEAEKKAREEFKARVTNIRGIALRIPLLMYGGADAGDPNEDLTVDNFTRKIKDESWAEFMPKGISKEDFNKIKKCFNATRFEEAGKRYRALTREADFMHVDERIQQIAEIFSYFRNPDKETVLTPWRVVNMHMSDTIGGYCFFDETFDEKVGLLNHPRFVDQGEVTKQLFDNVDLAGEVQTKILEINSKTGLYPLYVTYSLYRRRLEEYVKAECIDMEHVSVQEEQVVWDDIVADNMYVICNTPMAVGITRRTLLGFRQMEKKANIKNEQLIKRASDDQEGLIKELKSVGFWKGNTSKKEMDFNAVVGNPPYQIKDGGNRNSATPIYNLFVDLSRAIKPNYISMIMPAKWYTDGKGLGSFRESMLNDRQISKLFDFTDSRECFDNVDIAGGVCCFLWERGKNGLCEFVSRHKGAYVTSMRDLSSDDSFIRYIEAIDIVDKVKTNTESFYNIKVSSRKPFGLATNVLPLTNGDITLKYNKGKGPYNSTFITTGKDMIPKWKIVISYLTAEHAGQTDKEGRKKILSSLDILTPNEICSETYLVVDAVDTEFEANSVKSYLKTRFVRFLISLLASTQHLSKDKFAFVPIQDFTSSSDIDWNQPVANIDQQLYKKYNLTREETSFIEKMIKPMD